MATGLKEQGNRRFAEAVAAYSLAIDQVDAGDTELKSVLYSNRATALSKLLRWDEVLRDTARALTLHEFNARALLTKGIALCETNEWELGLEALRLAVDRGHRQARPKSFNDLAVSVMREYRKKLFLVEEDVALEADGKGLSLLRSLPSGDMESHRVVSHMEAVLSTRAHIRRDRKPPDSFVCPLSLSVMVDPVLVLPSGMNYERERIETHLRSSSEDPLTRCTVRVSDLVPNRALKQAIEEYLDREPWAFGE